ncbi:thiopeptide maturation pyridine synthase [Rhizohabitans arisaemae]|uniref:thiopeptide maturation pyridine synthase n=1 Tax=Rhizohabitans arisaemae TaxID=2720610 RepID=UPI0024B0A75D|nr:thiopeptide maturation pyridine synthase [Rhizohabitans arisaemae]
MTTSTWHSAHVFHHSPEGVDELILGAVRPLISALPAGTSGYFQRHWVLGPHVRINVRAEPGVWDRTVRPLIEEIVGGHQRRHPSAGHPDPEWEMRAHEKLAQLESEPGPLAPWQPDNTIGYAPFDPRLHVLGTPEASELLARFHVETTPLVFKIMEDVAGGAQRLDIALNLMLASAQVLCPPIDKGAISYRSHAEGFLANVVNPGEMRERFDRVFASNRESLSARLREVLAGVETGEHGLPHLAGWTAILADFQQRVQDLSRTGGLILPRVGLPMAGTGEWNRVSPFHRVLFGNEEVRRELDESEWFTVYRALLNYQYLFFSRFGMIPRERFLLCYLAARAVETEYDVRIPEMFSEAGLG